MSEPVTNVDIEDVLSSIRRLVSNGQPEARITVSEQDVAKEDQPIERLVLSPALRVDPQASKGSEGLSIPEQAAGQEGMESDPEGIVSMSNAEPTSVSDAPVGELADPEHFELFKEGVDFPESDFEMVIPDGEFSEEETPSEHEAGIFHSTGDPESEGETSASIGVGRQENPGARLTLMPWPDAGNGASVDEQALEIDDEEMKFAELRDEDGDKIPERDFEEDESVEHQEAAGDTAYPFFRAAAMSSGAGADQDRRGAMGEGKADHSEEPGDANLWTEAEMDEDALRDLVAEIVREELQGALGERITRNVRKLVRREIHRALSMQDFD